jgi:hypothetical protein
MAEQPLAPVPVADADTAPTEDVASPSDPSAFPQFFPQFFQQLWMDELEHDAHAVPPVEEAHKRSWRTTCPKKQLMWSRVPPHLEPRVSSAVRVLVDGLRHGRLLVDEFQLVTRYGDTGLSVTVHESLNHYVSERVCMRQALHMIRRVATTRRWSKALALCLDAPCSICLDAYARNQLVHTLPCGHAYHRCCVERWWTSSARFACPLCNRSSMQSAVGALTNAAPYAAPDGDDVIFQQEWFMQARRARAPRRGSRAP